MNSIQINFQDFLQIQNNQVVTNSDFIAQAFKKEHKNIIRNIENLKADINPNFFTQNFKETERTQKTGFGERKVKAYQLTKDGFMLLVMGFTGKAAMQIKVAYIAAFNAMAETLKQQSAVAGKDLGDILGECFAADAARRASESKAVAVPKKRRPKPLELPQTGFMLLMPDTGLYPVIPQGSKLWVDTRKTNLIDGKIYFIENDNGWWVRRLFRAPEYRVVAKGWQRPEFNFETDLANIRIVGCVSDWSVKGNVF